LNIGIVSIAGIRLRLCWKQYSARKIMRGIDAINTNIYCCLI
jgi:hypothetical protein